MGLFNPWVLLASGKIKHVDPNDAKIKGKKVGEKVDMGGGTEGIMIGKNDYDALGKGIDNSGMKGSNYVDDLAGDTTKAADEFDKLDELDDIGRGDKIRGGAKSERVPLRKEIKQKIYDKAFSGSYDANGYKIYLDGKTGKEIPNYGTHYPDVTPSGHPHPKAGQPVSEDLVGKPRADIGHVKGQKWSDRLAEHKKNGTTREDMIEVENNHKLYVLEERSSNRSRKND